MSPVKATSALRQQDPVRCGTSPRLSLETFCERRGRVGWQ